MSRCCLSQTAAKYGSGRWHTGAVDELTADRPLPPGPARRSPSPAVEMVRLGLTTDTRDLAGRLNAPG